MNNSGALDPNDPDLLTLAISDPNQYEADYPGLEGSLWWHGDLNCDEYLDQVDEGALEFFAKDPPCCLYDAECTEYQPCRADLDRSGVVELNDLNTLLATYGKCEGESGFNPDADFDNDGCVYLNDLQFLLTVYSQNCSCFDPGDSGGGGDNVRGGGVSVAIEAYDTNAFEGNGFAGESDHFVFDLAVEVLDAGDDWTASGMAVQAVNGAGFRLAAEPTLVDPLASFVRAPRDGDADESDAGTFVAGAFAPVGPLYEFEPDAINICWFDRIDSFDGPAAIMRLVIDMSGVPAADTSGGFGSVYFSQSGPLGLGDIVVAELQSAIGTSADGAGMSVLTGRFYVTASSD
jgi:hypothetical protein